MSVDKATGRSADRLKSKPRPTSEDDRAAATTVELPSEARPTAARAARLRARLSERDLDVLQALALLRLLTGDQIQRLCVHDGSQATQARRTRALLQRLSDLRLVIRMGRRVGGVRAGSSGFVYGLSGHGQAVLAVAGPMGGRRRRVWEISPSFQDHVLAVASVLVRLVEAKRADQLDVLAFEAEPSCWRSFPGAGGQTVNLKPDAYVRLGIGDIEHSAFVEVDLSTESPTTIARKCAVYGAYWRTGIEQNRRGVFPRVLWLVRDHHRLGRIAEVLHHLAAEIRPLFHLDLLANATSALTTAGEATTT